MKIISWNVNRYDIEIHEWVSMYLENEKPDIMFLSETKRSEEELVNFFSFIHGYKYIINVHNPYKWHGVAVLIRDDIWFNELTTVMKIRARYDCKEWNPSCGRIITLMLQDCIIVSTYVPNAGVETSAKKMKYRLEEWDPALQEWLNACSQSLPTIWIGDINVALNTIDVSNPSKMIMWAGFTEKERQSFHNFLSTGWRDVWRDLNPNKKWFSWRGSFDPQNFGIRLDNIVVSKGVKCYQADMITDCLLSDHIPVTADITLPSPEN